MITDRDIVVLSSLDWRSLWQAPQEIASRLGRAGNRVLYVENLGIRSPRLADASRVAARVRARARSLRSAGIREVGSGVHACSPLVLPPFGPSYRRSLNRRVFLPPIHRAVRALGMRDPVLWTFLPTDAVLDLVGMLREPGSVLIYTCLADFERLSPRPDRLAATERTLLESSDLVFARGPVLARRCERWSDRVHEIELGVDLDAFPVDAARNDPVEGRPGPARLQRLPRPIVGYVGALHRHVDLSLASAAALARPDWSWAYVGPVQVPMDDLAALPNVELVGDVSHETLAGYMREFDVCTIPYRLSSATETVLPAKLLEYLAMGKPVVSTALPEVLRFDAQRGLVSIAEGEPGHFVEAIERALATDGDESRSLRRRAVASLDWGVQLERMSALIERSTEGPRGVPRT